MAILISKAFLNDIQKFWCKKGIFSGFDLAISGLSVHSAIQYSTIEFHHILFLGVVFSDYDDQLKLQRNISMVALRSLGYGKKSIENKIIEEAEHLVGAFGVILENVHGLI